MKDVLADAGVPTARHAAFDASQEAEALAYLETLPGLYVVKTDGLAAGKGVVVTESLADARDAVREYLSGAAFGDAGRTLVIEEGLTGPELSLLVLCDGSTAGVPLAPAQDFKRIGDGDTGPNTGGMGAYSPVPIAGPGSGRRGDEHARSSPTLAALAKRDIEYRGVLYAGLMLTPEGTKVLEYNVRFGDPETQVVVPRLASDLAAHCAEAATGRLDDAGRVRRRRVRRRRARDRGLPGVAAHRRRRSTASTRRPRSTAWTVFHAGTARDGDAITTAGGRVLDVTAVGPTHRRRPRPGLRRRGLISWPGHAAPHRHRRRSDHGAPMIPRYSLPEMADAVHRRGASSARGSRSRSSRPRPGPSSASCRRTPRSRCASGPASTSPRSTSAS